MQDFRKALEAKGYIVKELDPNDPEFQFCPERWEGPYGALGLSNRVHVCAEFKPGHKEHICCCGATKPEE